jgi:hypothetical protein
MKKYLLVLFVFFLSVIAVYAQTNTNPVPQMDAAIKTLADNIHKKLIEEKSEKIAVGVFTYRGNVVPICTYWINQLTEELTNKPQRPYTILSGGIAGTDRTISGEIVDAANSIRIYTRIIRTDRAIEMSSHFDLERNEHINVMISPISTGDNRSSSSSVAMDAYEPDSFDSPVTYEIGANESAPTMDRTLHNADEDFFLLIPASDGRLIMETTGDVDTYMEFYNADTREKLAEDDDGGSRYNARIRYNVEGGKRYIAKVKGLSRSDMGSYGFRAYLQVQVRLTPDEYEPDDDSSTAKSIEIGVPQQHTFHNSNDVDWVKFQVTRAGRYTIRARGVNSNRLDTYIELYNSDLRKIGEDDDGGERLDARLSMRLENGLYYLKVFCLDDEPDQPYTISIVEE